IGSYRGSAAESRRAMVRLIPAQQAAGMADVEIESRFVLGRHWSAAAGVFPFRLRRQPVNPTGLLHLVIESFDKFPAIVPAHAFHRETFDLLVVKALDRVAAWALA